MNGGWLNKVKSQITQSKNVLSSMTNSKLKITRKFSSFPKLPQIGSLNYYQILIGANVGIYLLWNSNIVGYYTMLRHFALSKATLQQGNFHTLLTYGFSHQSGWHLFANMITLFFFGRTIELIFGPARLIQLYLLGTLLGGLMQLSKSSTYNYIIGASAATSAILSYFILCYPKETIYFYFF